MGYPNPLIAIPIFYVAIFWMMFRLAQKKGFFHGLLGFLFVLYPLIWCLIHLKDPEYGVRKPMMLLVVGIVLLIVFSGMAAQTSVAPQSSSFLPLFA